MKLLTWAFLFAFSVSAFAASDVRTYSIHQPGVGFLRIQIQDVGEPADQPRRMSVSIFCEDHRRVTNLVQPTWEDLIKRQPICYFSPYEHDKRGAAVILHYSTSGFSMGAAQCDHHWRRKLDLVQLCSAWRN